MRNKLTTSPNVPSIGEIEPLITTQDRLNNFILSASMIVQYASFRQRWASGLVIPTDPKTGKPVESFNAAVNRLWTSENPDTKFGEFSESDVTKVLGAIDATVKHMSAISQVPPVYLLGDIVNMSAEALAASEAGLQRKTQEKRTIFGEAWAQVMRLAAVADDGQGDLDDLFDNRIVWRDTEARSMASTVDALGKLSQMLQVPPQALWERVPGVTSSDVSAWKSIAEEADSMGALMGTLDAQAKGLAMEQTQAAMETQQKQLELSEKQAELAAKAPAGNPSAAGPNASGAKPVGAPGKDNAKPGTNVPGKASSGKAAYGTPSDKINYHKGK
jgi:hypothetical protein